MSDQEPQQRAQQDPRGERAPLFLRVVVWILVGGFVLGVLVLGTCALLIR